MFFESVKLFLNICYKLGRVLLCLKKKKEGRECVFVMLVIFEIEKREFVFKKNFGSWFLCFFEEDFFYFREKKFFFKIFMVFKICGFLIYVEFILGVWYEVGGYWNLRNGLNIWGKL